MTSTRDLNKELYLLLERLLARTITIVDAEALADMVVNIAAAMMSMRVHRKSWKLQRTGIRMYDVAVDLVAELVSGGDDEPCVMLRIAMERSINKAENGEKSGDDRKTLLVGACKAIISRTITQNVTRFFAECDPERGAVLRRLRKHVGRNPEIVTVASVCGRWYCSHNGLETMHMEPMPYEELASLPIDPSPGGRLESSVLKGLLGALDNQKRFRKAVLEMDVVNLIIDLASREYLIELENEMRDAAGPLVEHRTDEPNLDATVEGALFSAGSWMRNKMVETGKLSEYEAGVMLQAARLYLIDLRENETLGMYDYLRQTMPGLLYDHFRNRYRNRFQYLISKIFTDIGNRLIHSNGGEGKRR